MNGLAISKLPKKLRKSYTGFIPEYSIEIGSSIVLIDKTNLSVELKETHAFVQFGGTKYNLKIKNLRKEKSTYYFDFDMPKDTNIGTLEMALDKKLQTITVKGPGVVPDSELK